MHPVLTIAIAALVAGCALSQDTEGQIVELTDRTVKIRGAYDMSVPGKPATPTAAMISQARAVCPGAKYLTALPDTGNNYTFDYLFQCR